MTRGNLFGYMETVQKLASYYMIIMFQKTYMNYLPEIYHADVEHQIFIHFQKLVKSLNMK